MFDLEGMMDRPGRALHQYTLDLTELARTGALDPVRARDAETDRLIRILLRQGKNNPVLVGPAGVGKTAIVEGLAGRVALGDVPQALKSARVLSLSHMDLVAGTQYRGQYEKRLQGVVREATADPTVILFIDELHNLIGQGTAMGQSMDAANMLKPALARGEIRVIGATTEVEYERFIVPDAALERRFQPVMVRELPPDAVRDVLRARRPRFETHHGLAVSDDAIEAAIRLTDRFIPNRYQPDKALDFLDEACAIARLSTTGDDVPPDVRRLQTERDRLLSEERRLEALLTGRTAKPPADPVDGLDGALETVTKGLTTLAGKLGDELDRLFGGPARPAPASAPTETHDAARLTLARIKALRETIEGELRTLLGRSTRVVTGADVAEAVAAAVHQPVTWPLKSRTKPA